MLPNTSESVSRVTFGSRKHVAIFLWLPCVPRYDVASTQFASEWRHIHYVWLKMALSECVAAVQCL